MTTLNITVFNNKVLIDDPVVIPEGNYNTIFAVFDLPDEWDGLTAKVKFGNVAPITIPSSKTVAIPLFDIKGDVAVKVFAYALENDEYSLIHSPAPSQITICEGSFDTDGETPAPPTPETEYLDKSILWGGYSAYFEALTDAPADAVAEFESVDISSMTLEEVVTEIEIINKMILDAHSGEGGVSDVEVNGQSVVYDGVAQITIPPTPTIPVEDVKVNGSSVVDPVTKTADISVPTNYVTTDTEQEITSSKTFVWSGGDQGVTKEAYLTINPIEIVYDYGEESQRASHRYTVVIVFPTGNTSDLKFLFDDGSHWCQYSLPVSTTNNYLQIAATDDIPTNNNQLTNGAGYQTASDVSTAIENNQFVATYSKNSSNQWVCDKTFAEIEAAITAKKEVIAVTNDDFGGLPLKTYYTLEFYVPNGGVGFTNVGSLTGASGSYSVRLLSHISAQGTSENIGVEDVEVNLNLKEDVANKVTSLDVSSTDIQYPSAKCVYDALLTKADSSNVIANLLLKENVANKVTTIDTSSPSTTEYPSESAVVSYVSGLVGDINTILDSINGEVI